MSKDMKQLLLKGPGYSGRGVRICTLSVAQVEQIREEAAKEISEDGLPKEVKQAVYARFQKRAGIAAMVTEITERTGFKSRDELTGAAWKKPSVDDLTLNPGLFFTTKDLDALGDVFFRVHVAMQAEVDDIMGEALDVTAD